MLTEMEKLQVRRHLGYGPRGNQQGPGLQGGSFNGYRFFQAYGQMEFRLNNLSPEEEATLRGSGSPESPVFPNFIDPEDNKRYDGFLSICNVLQGKIATSTDNLDTTKAGDWTARQNEVVARIGLYNYWRSEMSAFVGIPLWRMWGAGAATAMVN